MTTPCFSMVLLSTLSRWPKFQACKPRTERGAVSVQEIQCASLRGMQCPTTGSGVAGTTDPHQGQRQKITQVTQDHGGCHTPTCTVPRSAGPATPKQKRKPDLAVLVKEGAGDIGAVERRVERHILPILSLKGLQVSTSRRRVQWVIRLSPVGSAQPGE